MALSSACPLPALLQKEKPSLRVAASAGPAALVFSTRSGPRRRGVTGGSRRLLHLAPPPRPLAQRRMEGDGANRRQLSPRMCRQVPLPLLRDRRSPGLEERYRSFGELTAAGVDGEHELTVGVGDGPPLYERRALTAREGRRRRRRRRRRRTGLGAPVPGAERERASAASRKRQGRGGPLSPPLSTGPAAPGLAGALLSPPPPPRPVSPQGPQREQGPAARGAERSQRESEAAGLFVGPSRPGP